MKCLCMISYNCLWIYNYRKRKSKRKEGDASPLALSALPSISSVPLWHFPLLSGESLLLSIRVSSYQSSCSLWPTRLRCPWDSPGKNTGVGAILFSRGSSQLRDHSRVSCIAGRFFTVWVTKEAPSPPTLSYIYGVFLCYSYVIYSSLCLYFLFKV